MFKKKLAVFFNVQMDDDSDSSKIVLKWWKASNKPRCGIYLIMGDMRLGWVFTSDPKSYTQDLGEDSGIRIF